MDFRKDLLPQIMNKISFVINNNTENKYYNQYFIGVQQRNSLAKNIGNDSNSLKIK